jgi:hypothetical protein
VAVDWHAFDLERLAEDVSADRPPADAAKTIWAFEQALRAARIDEDLLGYFLVAATCLVAHAAECSPRSVLEDFFRRSVSDETWRERYLPLFS